MSELVKNFPVQERLMSWLQGIESEVHFWNSWFETKGGEWPDDYNVRLNAAREFPNYLLDHLSDPLQAKILDVGAGPVTTFGFNYRGKKLDMIACDPLAPFYKKILQTHGVYTPVETVLGFAEELSSFFPPNTFDLVTCANALDHSFEPLRGIEEMLIVTKLGGRVILTHRINEAEFNKYKGLHQWNFDAPNGDFIIWNKEHNINLNDIVKDYADIVINYDTAVCYVTATITKKSHGIDISSQRYRQRIAEIMPATMMAVYNLVNSGAIAPSTI